MALNWTHQNIVIVRLYVGVQLRNLFCFVLVSRIVVIFIYISTNPFLGTCDSVWNLSCWWVLLRTDCRYSDFGIQDEVISISQFDSYLHITLDVKINLS